MEAGDQEVGAGPHVAAGDHDRQLEPGMLLVEPSRWPRVGGRPASAARPSAATSVTCGRSIDAAWRPRRRVARRLPRRWRRRRTGRRHARGRSPADRSCRPAASSMRPSSASGSSRTPSRRRQSARSRRRRRSSAIVSCVDRRRSASSLLRRALLAAGPAAASCSSASRSAHRRGVVHVGLFVDPAVRQRRDKSVRELGVVLERLDAEEHRAEHEA